MKPLRLELKGFTAFRESTVVDFEGRRLFVITGPTGAGKSSLLDAITWALYGQVPRVGASTRQLISHGATAMAVRFDFSTRGRRYRVSRRAPGTTATRLEHMNEAGDWVPDADRARDVTEQVTKILGLDYQTFIRTVLLPQGAFDSFLKGDQRERRDIMTRLLGLGLYGDARGIAGRRAATARTRAETLTTQLARIDVATPEAIVELEQERAALESRTRTLNERHERLAALAELARADRDAARAVAETAQRAAQAAAALRAAEQELAASRARIEQTAKQRVAKERERERLGYDVEAHRLLERRVALIVVREHAEADVARSRAALADAERLLAEAREATARATRERSAAAKAAERAERAREKSARAVASAAGRALRAAERLDREAAEADAEQQSAERVAAEREEHARQLEAICAQYEELRGELARTREAVEHARSSAKSAAAANATTAKGRERAEQGVAHQRELLETLRVRHAAARIQRSLKVGDRCPVCGETVHAIALEEDPNLDAAGAAVREAEHMLQETRALAERRATDAATAQAHAVAATRALDELQRRRTDMDARLGFAAEDGLMAAMEAAATAVAVARDRSAAARALAAERRQSAGALRLALAQLPREVPAAGDERGEATSSELLLTAIEAYLEAARVAGEAMPRRREAERDEQEAARAIQQAEQLREHTLGALAESERRLAERRSDDDAEPAALRVALAESERQAQRARTLDDALAQLAAARAAAEAQLEARAASRDRAAGEAAACVAALEVAGAAGETAHREFDAAWRAAIHEGEPTIDALRAIMLTHEAEERVASQQLGALGERLKHAREAVTEAQRMRAEIATHEQVASLAGTLEQELRGNRFLAFVQQEAMQLLAADASQHLDQFTSGRYELVAEDDEFSVVDRLNGDERRSVRTLSGGETFLASLALALSLSEHLPQLSGMGGAVSLESLFLDEGFGSLDAESLDLAVQGLETLAGGNRVIGVISHVEELAERLPDRIEVVKSGNSSSIAAR